MILLAAELRARCIWGANYSKQSFGELDPKEIKKALLLSCLLSLG
jgi:hypothetical protein